MMKNTNRLIDDFKLLTKNTVWKHMEAMAANYAVYSTHLKGLRPFLTDFDIYLYCNDTNMVIVCLDSCGHNEEHSYEEPEFLSALVLSEGHEPRTSTVWKVAEAVQQAKRLLQRVKPDMAVYGVLLTEAEILNAYELSKMWDAHNVMVIDDFSRLKYKSVKVNEDDDLPCMDFVRTLIDASFATVETPERNKTNMSACFTDKVNHRGDMEDDDDFARQLDEFLNESMEMVEENDTQDNIEDDLQEKMDTEPDDLMEEDDDTDEGPSDGMLFPDGEIEQNNNMSVKVDILRPVANPQEELDKLVGCADIKQRMDELVALTNYNRMMRELFPDNRQHEVSLHSVFLGRPGTGKTTVCKIFGSLLRQAGALTKGHVVVCDRGTFIGTLWGDEERAMRQVIDMAKGGVLMIDEAYLLNGKNDNDPGKLVVQLLMNLLADETQRDIAVVLCGYKEPMMKLLGTNPGLQSRFPNRFEFSDFTVEELLDITQRRISDYNYRFSTEAWKKYREMLTKAYQQRDPETWGNARFITNQLERIYIRHAARCVRQCPKDKSELLLLTSEDIVPLEMPRARAKVGF